MSIEKHEHTFDTVELVKIKIIDNKHYSGFAGDKAFLVHICSCGEKRAFDYGATEMMQRKLELLTEGK